MREQHDIAVDTVTIVSSEPGPINRYGPALEQICKEEPYRPAKHDCVAKNDNLPESFPREYPLVQQQYSKFGEPKRECLRQLRSEDSLLEYNGTMCKDWISCIVDGCVSCHVSERSADNHAYRSTDSEELQKSVFQSSTEAKFAEDEIHTMAGKII